VRAPGPPVRFLIAVIGLWVAGRATMLAMGGEEAVEVAADVGAPIPLAKPITPGALAEVVASPVPSPRRGPGPIALAANRPLRVGRQGPAPSPGRPEEVVEASRLAPGHPAVPAVAIAISAAEPPRGIAAAPVARPGSRWSGSVFLFARDGGGAGVPLAGGGQLGASQAGARIAYRLDEAGRIAAAARVYVPVDSLRGSEAAVGIDLRPLPDVPFRLSVERRIAIGREGRDAWSAYAAGGFFRGIGPAVELDGYAQAGVVGTKARDLFADGALRVARRFELGGGRAVLAGAGAWGAAQPRVARLDVGPRVALRLPAAGTIVSVAGEWRVRVAGDARPKSGPALTVAADF
jgi:hypothetical protein